MRFVNKNFAAFFLSCECERNTWCRTPSSTLVNFFHTRKRLRKTYTIPNAFLLSQVISWNQLSFSVRREQSKSQIGRDNSPWQLTLIFFSVSSGWKKKTSEQVKIRVDLCGSQSNVAKLLNESYDHLWKWKLCVSEHCTIWLSACQ